jgi:hypothetical protein
MGSFLKAASDDRLAADLLWQMKAIATKEVKSITSITTTTSKKKQRKTTSFRLAPRILISSTPSISSYEEESIYEEDHEESASSPGAGGLLSSSSYNSPAAASASQRSRTVSVGSVLDHDTMMSIPSPRGPVAALGHAVSMSPSSSSSTRILIKLSPRPNTSNTTKRRTEDPQEQQPMTTLDHFDWGSKPPPPPLLLSSPLGLNVLHQKQRGGPSPVKNSKRKREGFVGTAAKPEVAVRGTLRKKFSWKQYPEVRRYNTTVLLVVVVVREQLLVY